MDETDRFIAELEKSVRMLTDGTVFKMNFEKELGRITETISDGNFFRENPKEYSCYYSDKYKFFNTLRVANYLIKRFGIRNVIEFIYDTEKTIPSITAFEWWTEFKNIVIDIKLRGEENETT